VLSLSPWGPAKGAAVNGTQAAAPTLEWWLVGRGFAFSEVWPGFLDWVAVARSEYVFFPFQLPPQRLCNRHSARDRSPLAHPSARELARRVWVPQKLDRQRQRLTDGVRHCRCAEIKLLLFQIVSFIGIQRPESSPHRPARCVI